MENHLSQAVEFLHASGYRLLAAAFALFIGILTIRSLMRIIKAGILSTDIDASLVNFLLNCIRFVLYLALILHCLSVLRVSMTGFIAAISALTLAIGLSIQNTVSSVANGIMLFFLRPFKVGDSIELNGLSGQVREINILHTVINTPDNRRVLIPNSAVFNGTITNCSANKIRRVEVKASVDYDSDTELVRRIILDVFKKHPLIMPNPAPTVRWNAKNESYLEFAARGWVDNSRYWDAAFDLEEQVCSALRDNGICIPFPQMTLSFRDGAAAGAGPATAGAEPGAEGGGASAASAGGAKVM